MVADGAMRSREDDDAKKGPSKLFELDPQMRLMFSRERNEEQRQTFKIRNVTGRRIAFKIITQPLFYSISPPNGVLPAFGSAEVQVTFTPKNDKIQVLAAEIGDNVVQASSIFEGSGDDSRVYKKRMTCTFEAVKGSQEVLEMEEELSKALRKIQKLEDMIEVNEIDYSPLKGKMNIQVLGLVVSFSIFSFLLGKAL